MARGVHVKSFVIPDTTVSGVQEVGPINLGSENIISTRYWGQDSVGSVAIQFNTNAAIDSITVKVRADSQVPWVPLTADEFKLEGPFDTGLHYLPINIPVCSWLTLDFEAPSASLTGIRYVIQ
jgi:hypothetical protein